MGRVTHFATLSAKTRDARKTCCDCLGRPYRERLRRRSRNRGRLARKPSIVSAALHQSADALVLVPRLPFKLNKMSGAVVLPFSLAVATPEPISFAKVPVPPSTK